MSGLASGDESPWLPPYELDSIRSKVPMVYVEAIPIRLSPTGALEDVGMLLRASHNGELQRAFVSGRVLYQETVREALVRHLDKDLGPVAMPRLPAVLTPFTVAEYFPTPGYGFHDPRQHAVALVYAIPVDGDPAPSDDALDFSWIPVEDCKNPLWELDMVPGHAALLAHLLTISGSNL